MEICARGMCTGCMACQSVCAQAAIDVALDDMGCTVAHIDESRCVDCGACRAVCPQNHPPQLSRAKSAYAVWSREAADRARSSSGGAAAVLAAEVIARGGVAVGCACEDGQARHIAVERTEDIERLRGSKYVQSDMRGAYCAVRNALDAGRETIFFGTPCQVAGIQAAMQGRDDALITVDLICHGTPPACYLREHIQVVAPGRRVGAFSFRGERDWKLTLFDGSDVIYSRGRASDAYFAAFLGGLTFRGNCYSCPYKRPERAGDLTVGDFWGIDRRSLHAPYDGKISLVLPNTDRGRALLERCKARLVWQERPFEEAANAKQGDLIAPGKPPKGRAAFEASYPKMGFERAVRRAGVRRSMAQLLARELGYRLHLI